jgi:amidase
MKMTMMMPGWSAHGGQTLSPYVGSMEENENLLGHSVRTNNPMPATL